MSVCGMAIENEIAEISGDQRTKTALIDVFLMHTAGALLGLSRYKGAI